MAFIETWDESKPAGTRALNLGDDDIREFKRAIRERLAFGGMYFPSTDDALAGEFSNVRMAEQSSDPTSVANKGFTYTKDVGGVTELYYMDSAGTVVQLTTGGKIRIASLGVASEARGDLIVRGALAWGRLGIGANGAFLKSDGTDSSWVVPNFQTAATQAEMEAASSLTVPVTPGRTQYHPGVAKAWIKFNGTGTPAINASYNVASIADNGVGDYTLNWITAFSSADYAASGFAGEAAGISGARVTPMTFLATSLRIKTVNTANGVTDYDLVSVIAFGDQS